MKNLNTFTITLINKKTIDLNLPFHTVQKVKEFIDDNFNTTAVSISKH